ncbi:hypothetical protein GCM10010383_53190 [Streptomyces lomondensis]|uniref:Uncharacterized protein n=1 Tax=Streptomyces lomondensis TaxID=68229 RepID=A0ABQ2XGN1_9ACTN|nr:hypothetical protein GCM10010383_53190 [Streptomyces lomondensis]
MRSGCWRVRREGLGRRVPLAVADGIAAHLAPDGPQQACVKALGLLALIAGALQLSRVLADPKPADEVLEQGIHNATALMRAAS